MQKHSLLACCKQHHFFQKVHGASARRAFSETKVAKMSQNGGALISRCCLFSRPAKSCPRAAPWQPQGPKKNLKSNHVGARWVPTWYQKGTPEPFYALLSMSVPLFGLCLRVPIFPSNGTAKGSHCASMGWWGSAKRIQ